MSDLLDCGKKPDDPVCMNLESLWYSEGIADCDLVGMAADEETKDGDPCRKCLIELHESLSDAHARLRREHMGLQSAHATRGQKLRRAVRDANPEMEASGMLDVDRIADGDPLDFKDNVFTGNDGSGSTSTLAQMMNLIGKQHAEIRELRRLVKGETYATEEGEEGSQPEHQRAGEVGPPAEAGDRDRNEGGGAQQEEEEKEAEEED